MPSLNAIVSNRRTVLLVDASSARVQAGLLRTGAPPLWHDSTREAGIAIFECVDAVMVAGQIAFPEVGALVYCEGPGSILGIRTAAMALRTWQTLADPAPPAYAYRSLTLVAADLRSAGEVPPFAVISDARRASWNRVSIDGGTMGAELERVSHETLANSGESLFTLEGFRAWAPFPRPAREIPYRLPELWQRQGDADLLQPSAQPDAFLHEDPTYVTWIPQIHQAAHSTRR